MDRRAFIGSLAGGLLAAPLAAGAQQAGKTVRMGILNLGVPPNPEELAKATATSSFWRAMKELGWVEGQNIHVERRYGASDAQLRAGAADLVRVKVDVIMTSIGFTALAAKGVTQTIPIVMANSGDAVRQGLVASLAHPGGNVTGLTSVSPETSRKRLALLREAMPKLSKVGVLWCGSGPSREVQRSPYVSRPGAALPEQEWAETREAAKELKVQLVSLEVFGCQVSEAECSKRLAAAMALATKQRVEAMLMFDCTSLLPSAIRITDLATRNRLAGMYPFSYYCTIGGLMSYGVDTADMLRRAATYVDKVLKGARPADLPVEGPSRFELVINLKTAKALGLTIPQSVLIRADEVIQ